MSITGCGSSDNNGSAETELALAQAAKAQAEAELAKAEAEIAKAEAEKAKAEVEKAEADDAEAAKEEALKEEKASKDAKSTKEDKAEKTDVAQLNQKDDTAKNTDEGEVKETDTDEGTGKSSEAVIVTDMSDDLYSFQVSLNGEIFQFPMKYTDFIARGWVFDGEESDQLDPGQYSLSEVFDLGDVRAYCNIINFDVNVIEKKDAYVASIKLDDYGLEETGVEAVLPGGIVFGKATAEDIEAVYGKASDAYIGESYSKYTYAQDSYERVVFEVDKETGVLSAIDVRNFKAPATLAEPTINSEVPDVVKNYKQPQELGSDMTASIVEYDGDIYRLPMPVSVMVDNGWKIVDGSGTAVVAKGFTSIDIMKNNQKVHVYMNNFADYATVVENCFVTHIKSSEYGPLVPMMLAEGITIGTDEATFMAVIDAYYVKEETGTSHMYYKVKASKNSDDYIEVSILNETKKIVSIEMNSDELK